MLQVPLRKHISHLDSWLCVLKLSKKTYTGKKAWPSDSFEKDRKLWSHEAELCRLTVKFVATNYCYFLCMMLFTVTGLWEFDTKRELLCRLANKIPG